MFMVIGLSDCCVDCDWLGGLLSFMAFVRADCCAHGGWPAADCRRILVSHPHADLFSFFLVL